MKIGNTEKMRRIAIKVSKWAKRNGIPLEDINPAFGPLINAIQEKHSLRFKALHKTVEETVKEELRGRESENLTLK